MNELNILNHITNANVKGFPKLIDWGQVDFAQYPRL